MNVKSMKFYLINPRSPPSFTSWEYAAKMMFRYGGSAPLGLLTAAAMIPTENEVVVCDENTHAVNFNMECDYVCLTGMHLQKQRIKELAAEFRKRGKKIILGGPSVMAVPEDYRDDADIRIVGEAERIWPQCLQDIANGCEKSLYVEEEKIDLSLSPIPRYDLLSVKNYISVSIQTTRGCPYVCEFCDIITLYGRRPRVKPVENIINEIKYAIQCGAERIAFTDDNFIGDPRYAKKLLAALIELQSTIKNKFVFVCQVTINLAINHELLDLMRQAGCASVFIGVESPRTDSLKETGKIQNLKRDMISDLNIIRSYGIKINGGMIIGFDHDDIHIFHEQLTFIQDAHFVTPLVSLLGALPGTPLHARVKDEGRLVDDSFTAHHLSTNIIPKYMSIKQLYGGFLWLHEQIYLPENFTKRVLGEIALIEKKQLIKKRFSPFFLAAAIVWVFFWYLFDRNRSSLLRVFVDTIPTVVTRHYSSTEYLIEYLLRYYHACKITHEIEQEYIKTYGARWIPPSRNEHTPDSSIIHTDEKPLLIKSG